MPPSLTDPFGRRIDYLRLAVTDRCDLRCTYCLPRGFRGFARSDSWLRFEEIERLAAAFVRLGVRRIRLTGGEPLTRRGLPALAARLAALPALQDLSISTNGVRLAQLAHPLRAAGVHRLNVSLDSLNPARYAAITGGGKLADALAGLEAAREAGFAAVKINMVVMRDINDDEVERMVEFCAESGHTLRLIETMPMGETGRGAGRSYIDLGEVRARLARRFQLIPATLPGGGPARYVQIAGTDFCIGFIAPISQHFCATCNRVRITAEGVCHLCLGQEHTYDFRPLLRSGAGEAALERAALAAIARKPERHEFRERPGKVGRFMSMTGG